MNSLLIAAMIIASLCVLGVLILGLLSMVKGGEFNQKYGNRLMLARVVLQGLTLLMLALAFFSQHV